MLTAPGRWLSPQSGAPRFTVIPLMSSLPSEFTCTRSDTVSTCRDNSGQLQVSTTNTPRFDHSTTGTPLGLLIEGTMQNKLTIYNANPTATTNWTKGGAASSTFTVITDPSSYLATAKLNGLCTNGKLYKLDNTGGATDAWVDSAATFGATTIHTISAWICTTVAQAQLTRSGTSPTSITINTGAALLRQSLPLTPNASGDQMRILAKPGAVVYFILPQMEANPFATSVIVTTGAAATRQTDRIRITNIGASLWFDQNSGYMLARYKPAGLQPAGAAVDQFIISLHNNATTNVIGTRIIRGDADISMRLAVAGTSVGPATNNVPRRANETCVTATSWSAAQCYILDGGIKAANTPASFPPVGIIELSLGARNSGTEPLSGWIQSVEIGAGFKSAPKLGARTFTASDILVAGGGQSLMGGYFDSQADHSTAGRDKMTEVLAAEHPASAIVFSDGSTGATYASLSSTSIGNADYWWDLHTGTPGPILNNFYTRISESGIVPNVILWSQGEADSSRIPTYTTKTQYKDALLGIFNHMRQRFGSVPVIIQRLGRRTGTWTNTGGPQAVREVQEELFSAYNWIHRGPETYDLGLFDGVHLDNAGYVTAAQRTARKLTNILGGSLTGIDGPRISSAVRSGTTITVTLTHDGGTDFTPSSAIDGFKYFDNSSNAVTISTAVRTNATTITLTLASGVAGTLYYGYDAMLSLNTANVVKDNTPLNMPLRTSKIAIA